MERSIKNGDFVFLIRTNFGIQSSIKRRRPDRLWRKIVFWAEFQINQFFCSRLSHHYILVSNRINLIQADSYIAWIFCTTQVFCKCFLLHVNLLQINMQMFWFPCLSKWCCHIVFRIAYLYLRGLYQDISQWVCMVWFHVSCLLVWMLCTIMLIYNWIVT